MKLVTRLFLFVWPFVTATSLFAQCIPDSLISGPPGVYPDTLEVIPGCQYSETDITFLLPRDTTTLVFGQLFTVPFNSFRIDSIRGLPNGMTWACDNQPDCVYDVFPGNPAPDTFGCVRITGTPTVPGTYDLIVYLTANVTLLGNDLDQTATYTKPLTVSGCSISTDCYTYSLDGVCPPAVISLENGLDSSVLPQTDLTWTIAGSDGFLFQTSLNDPFPLVLQDPAAYILSFEAVLDTFPFQLDSIVLQSVNCSDLLDEPDLYWQLIDPSGANIINTITNPVNNAALPLTIQTGKIALEGGTYVLQVWDADPIGGNDGCAGSAGAGITFSAPPLSPGPQTVTLNGLTATFYVTKPLQFVACQDTFTVFPRPDKPRLSVDTTAFCFGDSATIVAVSADSLIWYRDFEVIPDAEGDTLVVKESGFYQVEAINTASLCRELSSWLYMEAVQVPTPAIVYDGNGTFAVSGATPAYAYQWYDDQDMLVKEGSNFQPSGSGVYYAAAVDTLTGCRSAPTKEISVILSSLAHMYDAAVVEMYPNPATDQVTLSWEFYQAGAATLRVLDLMGRNMMAPLEFEPNQQKTTLNVSGWPSGMYLLTIQSDHGRATGRLEVR